MIRSKERNSRTGFALCAWAAIALATVSPVAGAAEAEKAGCKVLDPDIADTYVGECRNGVAEGNGTAKGKDSYEGGFAKGVEDGVGRYEWGPTSTTPGQVYVGECKAGTITGKGVMYYASGASYDGDFVDMKRNGYGVYRWVDGTSYTGGYLDGKRQGFGEMRMPRSVFEADGHTTGRWEGDVWIGTGIWYQNSLVVECATFDECRVKAAMLLLKGLPTQPDEAAPPAEPEDGSLPDSPTPL